MEKLFQRFNNKLKGIPTHFKRYLFHQINWNDRLIAIKGSRGVGKTTLLLQYIKANHTLDGTVLYVSLDDIYFQAIQQAAQVNVHEMTPGYIIRK